MSIFTHSLPFLLSLSQSLCSTISFLHMIIMSLFALSFSLFLHLSLHVSSFTSFLSLTLSLSTSLFIDFIPSYYTYVSLHTLSVSFSTHFLSTSLPYYSYSTLLFINPFPPYYTHVSLYFYFFSVALPLCLWILFHHALLMAPLTF